MRNLAGLRVTRSLVALVWLARTPFVSTLQCLSRTLFSGAHSGDAAADEYVRGPKTAPASASPVAKANHNDFMESFPLGLGEAVGERPYMRLVARRLTMSPVVLPPRSRVTEI